MCGKSERSLCVMVGLAVLALGAGAAAAAAEPGPPETEKEKWKFPLTVSARDEDNDQLTYQWVQVSGPQVKIADPASASTYFVPADPGEYVFEIRVSDGQATSTAKVTRVVTLPNEPPVAVAGPDQNYETGQRVLVDGSHSFDRDGKVTEYKWRQVSGPPVKLTPQQLADRQFNFVAAEAGLYVFELMVSDGRDSSPPSRTTVNVKPPNRKPVIVVEEARKEQALPIRPPAVTPGVPGPDTPPVANAGKGGVAPLGEDLLLDGSGSSDPLGEDLDYFWTQKENGKSPLLKRLDHDPSSATAGREGPFACPVWHCRPTAPGNYEFELQVAAGKGDKKRKASASVTYEVRSANHPPTAEIFVPEPKVEKGQPVALDGSRSRDPDGDPLDFVWAWSGKGLRPTKWAGGGARVQFIAEEEGQYGIRLVVNDGKDKSAPADVTVDVLPAHLPPTVEAPASVEGTLGQPVRVQAVVKSPQNDRTEVVWTVVDPPGLKLPSEVLNANPLVFTPKEKRVYLFSVVARDARSTSAPAQVQVAVRGAEHNLPPTAIIEGRPVSPLGEDVVLNGEKSSDPEHQRLTYQWKQVEGPPIPGPRPGPNGNRWVFTPTEAGEYQVSLVVSDGVNESAPHVWQFMVLRESRLPPVGEARPPEVGEVKPPVIAEVKPPVAGESKPPVIAEVKPPVTGESKPPVIVEVKPPVAGESKPPVPGEVKPPVIVEVKPPVSAEVKPPVAGEAKPPEVGEAKPPVSAEANPLVADVVKPPVVNNNHPPVAVIDAAPPMLVGDKETWVSGAASRDADGDPLTYHWRVVEGEDKVELTGRDQPRLEVKALAAGVVRLELIVNDGKVDSAPALTEVVIRRQNQPPVAAPSGPDSVFLGQEVTLRGTDSQPAPGGRIAEYRWSQVRGDGPDLGLKTVDQEALTFRPAKPGAYVLQLVVVDENGSLSPPKTWTVTVQEPVRAPVARLTPEASGPYMAGQPIVFSAAKSNDPGGHPLTFRWRVVGENAAKLPLPSDTGETLKVVPAEPGEFTLELRVHNGQTESPAASLSFQVVPVSEKPVAVVAPVTGCEPGGRVVLDGSGSVSPLKKSLDYTWRVVSAPEGAKPGFSWRGQKKAKTEVTLPRAGEYVFELKVAEGKQESDPVTVTVRTGAPNQAPLASAVAVAGFTEEDLASGVDLTTLPYLLKGDVVTVEEGWPILLDGSGSTDPDKGPHPLTYTWHRLSGPTPAKVAQDGPRLRFQAPAAGQLVYELTVTDGKAQSRPAAVTLTILKPGVLPVSQPRVYLGRAEDPPPAEVAKRSIEITAAARTARPDPAARFLILDGQASTGAAGKKLNYTWQQVGGEDLQLRPDRLAKPRVGLMIYHPGQYRFLLRVSDGQRQGVPAVVDVTVKDASLMDGKAPKIPAPEVRPEGVAPEGRPGANLGTPSPSSAGTAGVSPAGEKSAGATPAAPRAGTSLRSSRASSAAASRGGAQMIFFGCFAGGGANRSTRKAGASSSAFRPRSPGVLTGRGCLRDSSRPFSVGTRSS